MLFTRSSVDGHLGCFHFFMSNAVINICVYVFVSMYVFSSLEYIPSNGREYIKNTQQNVLNLFSVTPSLFLSIRYLYTKTLKGLPLSHSESPKDSAHSSERLFPPVPLVVSVFFLCPVVSRPSKLNLTALPASTFLLLFLYLQ